MQVNCPWYRRGSSDYESIRRAVVWNGLKPERYPEVIIQVNNVDDVVTAVKYAAFAGMKIGVRSGGHSWTSNFLRDGGMLLDVSKLNSITIDSDRCTATAGPGAHGGTLNQRLSEHGYMFPGGHCPTVGLGGYLLQGGFGWNSRVYGLGCENVLAIDVVTPDGTSLHADMHQNQDLLWAARGSGHGFFGVVTNFYLQCHPLPKSIRNTRYWLDTQHLHELLMSLDDAHDGFPRHLEVSVFIGYDQDEVPGLTALVRGDCLAMSDKEARNALDLLDRIPVLSKAIKADTFQTSSMDVLLDDIGGLLEVNDHNFVVDNTWMDVPLGSLLPQIQEMVNSLGQAPAHLYLLYFNRKDRMPKDMAFSMEGRVYISYLAIFKDSTERTKWTDTVARHIGSIARSGVGSQLADENLLIRPARFMATEKFRQLESIRQKYDPEGTFHGFMGLPDEFQALSAQV